jgi:uncharacterized protein (DUF302 family)
MHATNTTTETFVPTSNARALRIRDVPMEEVRFRLAHALGQEGFAVIAEIDFADLLSRRLDVQRAPFFTYEVCHPKLADEALSVSGDAGLLLPCKVCVWREGTEVVVATLPAGRLVAALGRPHLDDVARQADERLERVFARLTGPTPVRVEIPGRPTTAPALTANEVTVLREAVQRQIHVLMSEVAGTESHALQHAIAQTIEQLEGIARKFTVTAAAPITVAQS